MLYVFAGFPGKDAGVSSGLGSLGLSHCIEGVENLGTLIHDPAIQYRRDGVWVRTDHGEEWLRDVEYRMSDMCLRDGITWDWFRPQDCFGNGVTMRQSHASPTMKTVIQGTDLSEDEYLTLYGPTPVSALVKERKHIRTESWETYEARWLPGTCPQETHIVHLTTVVATAPFSDVAYERLVSIVEYGAGVDRSLYSDESGKHFSEIGIFDGKFIYQER